MASIEEIKIRKERRRGLEEIMDTGFRKN